MKPSTETYYVYDKDFNLVGKYWDIKLCAKAVEISADVLMEEYLDKPVLAWGMWKIKTDLITKAPMPEDVITFNK